MKKSLNFFTKILNKLPGNHGFTMIELLVVISVIGILAVAVLSSINPIEQINKGRDTRTRSDAAQLINAVDRYFSIHESYPWNDASSEWTPTSSYDEYDEAFDNVSVTGWGWTQVLVDTQEVKEGYINRLENDDNIIVFKATGQNSTMYACFLPSSNAFKQEAAVNCDSTVDVTPYGSGDGVPASITTCETRDGTYDNDTENYICLP